MKRNTLTEENYLKAIFHLSGDGNEVALNEISKLLDVKMPTVNNMMKKFADKKWVKYESYKPLKITALGKKEAALVVRKHRLTEMFLVEKMNFGWENVHEIAEQLEHIHSIDFFNKMDELLDFPKFDPHGEPIPDREGNIIPTQFRKLGNCKPGEKLTFKAVTYSDDDFLNYLNKRKLQLGSTIEILSVEVFDQSLNVRIGKRTENLGAEACEKILVQ